MQTAETEQQLLRRCLNGESQAQFALYNQYVTAMYNTTIRMVASVPEAEDVLQESFSKVFQQLHTFRSESTIGAWIKRIVVNTALLHLRAQKKLQFVALETWPDYQMDNEEEIETWDASTLHEAIKRLPDGCRVIFNLFAVENMGHKAIAQALGISESTSKTQFMRAKQLIRRDLVALKNAGNAFQ